MKAPPVESVRCAIYTRVSTEQGLDQEFNSLDAQYDAASAYIKSQAHAGWTLIRSRYDDGGYSGGSTDRPDLQRLLGDIRTQRIDVVVVYKVDRLTRSLADFAKLVELFDAHGVSFVSVTQQFNTITSMGRLTLNVLLSFAQFEREVTSERIRDKIAASKRKGIWVGGNLPLGYEMKDGKIAVVEEQAEQVRLIFRRYLELGSVNELIRDLRERNIRTKTKKLSAGTTRGGIPFGRGALFYLLSNHFYIGEVKYRGEILPGEQPPIMDRALFEAVRQKALAQWSHRTLVRNKSEHLLAGLLFDDAGHRMVPTHATKAGVRYRYYVSTPFLHGEAKTASAGSVPRVPAADIDEAITKSLRERLAAKQDGPTTARIDDREILAQQVSRIVVRKDKLIVRLKSEGADEPSDSLDDQSLTILWQKPPSKKSRQILLPKNTPRSEVRPERFERRARLVEAIARGRRWLDDVVSGRVTTVAERCAREKCSVRQVNTTISLAFLAPNLVRAAVQGRLPRGIGIERLRDLPTEWSQQFEALGLNRNSVSAGQDSDLRHRKPEHARLQMGSPDFDLEASRGNGIFGRGDGTPEIVAKTPERPVETKIREITSRKSPHKRPVWPCRKPAVWLQHAIDYVNETKGGPYEDYKISCCTVTCRCSRERTRIANRRRRRS